MSGADDPAGRITTGPAVLVGEPGVRGTRGAVADVLERLAAGWSDADVLENYPTRTAEDIQACRDASPASRPGT